MVEEWCSRIERIAAPADTFVGASAAAMGLLGTYGVYLLYAPKTKQWKRELYKYLLVVALQLVVFDSLIPNVGRSAHLIGFCAGGLIAYLFERKAANRSD